MILSQVPENATVQIGHDVYKRGARNGRIVYMELVYPAPDRTVVRPMLCDTPCITPTVQLYFGA